MHNDSLLSTSIASSPHPTHNYLDDLLFGRMAMLGWPYVMLMAYADESGTGPNDAAICVGGLLFKEQAAKSLTHEWRAAISDFGIKCFHATDCAHRKREFSGLTPLQCGQLYTRLITLIREYASCGIITGCTMPEQEFKKLWPNGIRYSRYSACAYYTIMYMRHQARELGDDEVIFSFEIGHPKFKELRTLVAQLKNKNLIRSPFRFPEKREEPLLQTADILCYEWSKHLNERKAESSRPPRLSLKNLPKTIMAEFLVGDLLTHTVASICDIHKKAISTVNTKTYKTEESSKAP